MRQSRGPLAAVSVWVVLSLAACGGGSKRLTKDEFITKWDAICTSSDREQSNLGSNLPEQPTQDNLSKFDDYLKKAIPLLKDEIKDLSKPKPPEADQATIDGILSNLNKVVDGLEDAEHAAARGDLDGFNAAGDKVTPNLDAANTAATSYGFKACGSTQ
jgi:hypothetical protein